MLSSHATSGSVGHQRCSTLQCLFLVNNAAANWALLFWAVSHTTQATLIYQEILLNMSDFTRPTAECRDTNSQQQDDIRTLKCALDTLLALEDDHPVRGAIADLGIDNINDMTSLIRRTFAPCTVNTQTETLNPSLSTPLGSSSPFVVWLISVQAMARC